MASGPKNSTGKRPERSLRDEVREALLTLLRDKTAPATARASAGRTLLDHYGERPTAQDVDLDGADEAELDRLIKANSPGSAGT